MLQALNSIGEIVSAKDIFQTMPPYPGFKCIICGKCAYFKPCEIIESHFVHYNASACPLSSSNQSHPVHRFHNKPNEIFDFPIDSFEINDYFTCTDNFIEYNSAKPRIRWVVASLQYLDSENHDQSIKLLTAYSTMSSAKWIDLICDFTLLTIYVARDEGARISGQSQHLLDRISKMHNHHERSRNLGSLLEALLGEDDFFKLRSNCGMLFNIQPAEPEEDACSNPAKALDYLKNNNPNPKVLAAVARDAKSSYLYAKQLQKPFEMGEAAIMSDPRHAYLYAKDILHGPFPAAEKALAGDPEFAHAYARDVVKGPFLLGEAVLATHPRYAYLYAKEILRGPFPAAEKELANDPAMAYAYARDVVKGPFPLGEAVLATHPRYAYLYAKDILRGPFPAAEKILTSDKQYCFLYSKDVLRPMRRSALKIMCFGTKNGGWVTYTCTGCWQSARHTDEIHHAQVCPKFR